MSRISAGIAGPDLALQRNLLTVSNELQQVTGRLATLKRVNSGADDPAALIGSEVIRAELVAIEAADRNAAHASSLVAVADGALEQVSGLLSFIQGITVAAASSGLSDAETAAYQIQIDAAVEAIHRIGAETNLSGTRLLDGSSTELTFLFATDPAETVSLELPEISAYKLGNEDGVLADLTSGGSLSLTSDSSLKIEGLLEATMARVNEARGKLGVYERNAIDVSGDVLAGMESELSQGLSLAIDADIAKETASMVQLEIVRQAGFSSLHIASERHRLTDLLLDAL